MVQALKCSKLYVTFSKRGKAIQNFEGKFCIAWSGLVG